MDVEEGVGGDSETRPYKSLTSSSPVHFPARAFPCVQYAISFVLFHFGPTFRLCFRRPSLKADVLVSQSSTGRSSEPLSSSSIIVMKSIRPSIKTKMILASSLPQMDATRVSCLAAHEVLSFSFVSIDRRKSKIGWFDHDTYTDD